VKQLEELEKQYLEAGERVSSEAKKIIKAALEQGKQYIYSENKKTYKDELIRAVEDIVKG